MSIEPSPFLPQTTIAMESVKTAASAAQPKVKSIRKEQLCTLYYAEVLSDKRATTKLNPY